MTPKLTANSPYLAAKTPVDSGRRSKVGTPAQVVMEPADDYVREFTHDVPRAKVLMVRNILEPAADGLDPSAAVADTMNLEQVLPHVAKRLDPLPVADADGRLVGQITPQAVLTALAGKQRGEG